MVQGDASNDGDQRFFNNIRGVPTAAHARFTHDNLATRLVEEDPRTRGEHFKEGRLKPRLGANCFHRIQRTRQGVIRDRFAMDEEAFIHVH